MSTIPRDSETMSVEDAPEYFARKALIEGWELTRERYVGWEFWSDPMGRIEVTFVSDREIRCKVFKERPGGRLDDYVFTASSARTISAILWQFFKDRPDPVKAMLGQETSEARES